MTTKATITGIAAVYDIVPDLLINSLYTLTTQYDRQFSYCVVDYGSSPSYRAAYERITADDGPFGFVELIRVDRDTDAWSISRAFNIGIRLARTDYVFTTGADILFPPTLVAQLKALLSPATFVRTPMVAFDTSSYLRATGEGAYYNAVLAMPRKWLMEVGGYDERYFWWGSEDEDIIHRLRLSGFDEKNADLEPVLHQAHPERRFEGQAMENRKILESSYGVLKRNINTEWGEL